MKTDETRTRRQVWALLAGVFALLLVAGLSLLLSRFQVLAQPLAEVTADLAVSKEVNKTQAAPGETLVYTITINNGAISPVDAWMTDTLPVELVSVSGLGALLGDVGFENGVITWSYTLPPLGMDQITFSAQISPEITYAVIENTAQVAIVGGPIEDEDSAETTVLAEVGNLDNEDTYKTVSSDEAEPGDVLTYTIRVTNDDPDPVPDARFSDRLPDGLTLIGEPSALVGNVGFDNGVITWSHALDALSFDEVYFSVQISPDLPYDGWVTNTVEIVAPGQSFTRSVGTDVQRRYPNLEASKSVYPTSARPDEYLTYTVRIANTGDGPASTVWMTDRLPSEVSYVAGRGSVTMGSFGEAGGVVTWNVTTDPTGGTLLLPPQAEAAFTFTVQILSDLSENALGFVNTAEITGAGRLVTATVEADAIVSYNVILPLVFRHYPPVPVLESIPTSVNRSYTVSWRGVNVPFDHYVLQQARSPDFTTIDQFWTHRQTYQSIQNAYCAYYYRVRMDNASVWGQGPWSNVEQGVASPPDPPILNDISDPDEDNSYTVSWSSVSVPVAGVAVDYYVLQEATDAGFTNVTGEWSTTLTSQLIIKGSSYGTFYYRVRADDEDCWSQGPWSNVKSITTRFFYFDDFSDYRSGWPREWEKTRAALYQVRPYEHPKCPGSDCPYDDGDGYIIARRSGGSPKARFSPEVAVPSENYEIEVDARWWDANYYATYQIIFGADDDLESYYAVQVRTDDEGDSPDCEYSVVRKTSSAYVAGTTYLKDWKRSSRISCRQRRHDSRASWDRWRIRREDDYITVWLDGDELGSWKDRTFGANRYFGVGCTLYEGFTPSKPEFDNWSVVTLP